ncbi:hypothetical protein [Salinicola sp. DM10]|uniref:hypothetical protein n=1 Tax=Salinicola sp. DM10 TaxID=2815721 RepID=UPI001A8E1150|nr:hypothetical protein [Salinicola sp. DM10]MCE3026398.1 hypothetical protein [Salinicola sp. DM10]
MSMINTIIARVSGASRYEFDGRKGGKLSVINEVDADNDDQVGMQCSDMSADFSIVEQIRNAGAELPCNLELDIELRMVRAGQNRQQTTSMHVIAVRRPKGTGHSSAAPSAKAEAPKA